MKSQKVFNDVKAFRMKISYAELNADSPSNVHDHHIHDECEIYINLTGDVSFVVEDTVYPVMPGNIIITRPYEWHHCLYHSNKLHKHFCVFLQSAQNEHLFNIFYDRELGKNNLIVLNRQNSDELIQICRRLNTQTENEIDRYLYFFRMLQLLSTQNSPGEQTASEIKSVIAPAIEYINNNFQQKISICELAESCHISVSTFERNFFNMFKLTPSEYIRKRRLANTIKMLAEGYSITDTAYQSGFSDCSGFIATFKKEYGITPLKYKKNLN